MPLRSVMRQTLGMLCLIVLLPIRLLAACEGAPVADAAATRVHELAERLDSGVG